ncbi:hypothetical protein [Hoylesella nanceiensis]
MRKLLLLIAFLISMSMQAQKILSQTKIICKLGDSHIRTTEYADGAVTYTVYFAITDLTSIGKPLSKADIKDISLIFNSKERMLKCLRYLYEFDKGEGYYIDLENMSENKAFSTKDGFMFSQFEDIDKPIVTRYFIGKLLNTFTAGKKVKNKDKSTDDMYLQ